MDGQLEGLMFVFHDPGRLVDGELELVLIDRYPGDPAKNWVPAYRFKMTVNGRSEQVGRIDLRLGETRDLLMYAGHIGYYVSPDYRGRHYAARSCLLLLDLARSHGMGELWITTNPDNWPSRRTCELVGAELVEIVDVPRDHALYAQGDHQKCRYRVTL